MVKVVVVGDHPLAASLSLPSTIQFAKVGGVRQAQVHTGDFISHQISLLIQDRIRHVYPQITRVISFSKPRFPAIFISFLHCISYLSCASFDKWSLGLKWNRHKCTIPLSSPPLPFVLVRGGGGGGGGEGEGQELWRGEGLRERLGPTSLTGGGGEPGS